MNTSNCPPWLKEQAEISALLDYFVTKLDGKPEQAWIHSPGVTITKKRYPWLFSLDEQSDQKWDYLLSLVNDYGIFELKRDKKRNPLDPEFSSARLRLNLDTVDLLRRWLDRPLIPSVQKQWRTLVDKYITDNTEQLKKRAITYEGKSLEDVITAFTHLGRCIDQGLTLRQLSAKYFWGDSKFLEGREELIVNLFPKLIITPRPVIINVFLPKEIHAVLFIENQDSYLNAVYAHSNTMRHLALVYCAGYRGTADRIRDPQSISLHYQGTVLPENQQHFESWWYKASDTDIPVYFWGDLDFAGMSILKTLKQRFNHIQAWQSGYQKMLQHLEKGNAHPLQSSNKGDQPDPGTTGCAYADTTLLPAIRRTHTYVDQEVVSWIDTQK